MFLNDIKNFLIFFFIYLKNQIFGGFNSVSWSMEPHYYGSGETFLFSLKPAAKLYRWTGANNNFICSRRDFIAMGGG
jgi:hypothetical protein